MRGSDVNSSVTTVTRAIIDVYPGIRTLIPKKSHTKWTTSKKGDLTLNRGFDPRPSSSISVSAILVSKRFENVPGRSKNYVCVFFPAVSSKHGLTFNAPVRLRLIRLPRTSLNPLGSRLLLNHIPLEWRVHERRMRTPKQSIKRCIVLCAELI